MVEKCQYGATCPVCNYPLRRACEKFVASFIDEQTTPIKSIVKQSELSKENPIIRGRVYMVEDLKRAKVIAIRTLYAKLSTVKTMSFNVAVTYGLEQMEVPEEFVFIDANPPYQDNMKALGVIESYADILSSQGKFVLVYTKSTAHFKSFTKC